jgi:C4-dicarboxylate transporter DctM subunit
VVCAPLIIGAQIFSFFIAASALTDSANAYISLLNWPAPALMALILVGYLLLGTIMEGLCGDDHHRSDHHAVDPLFGLNVFVLKSITPDVSLWTIYKGVTPFVVADLIKLALLVVFPLITLWLPYTMMR